MINSESKFADRVECPLQIISIDPGELGRIEMSEDKISISLPSSSSLVNGLRIRSLAIGLFFNSSKRVEWKFLESSDS